jgi:hypothetical protein
MLIGAITEKNQPSKLTDGKIKCFLLVYDLTSFFILVNIPQFIKRA